MHALRRSPWIRYVVITLSTVAWLSACHHWVRTERRPARVIAEAPDQIRVWTSDAENELRPWILESPRVEGDSLAGLLKGSGERVAIATADIHRVDVREFHLVPTVFLITGGVVVGAFVALGIAIAAGGGLDFDFGW